MLAAVVFDFDGIIVDSEPMHFRAFNTALQPLNIQISWKDYCETYIGYDDRDAFRAIFKNNGIKKCARDVKHLIEEKAKVFQTYVHNGEATPLPGAVELIQSIPNRLPVALCSGALREDIDPIIKNLGIANAFCEIVTAENTPKSKPHPAPYQLTLKRLGIEEPASVVAIEDTPAGIMSAKGAGLKVLAVTNSYDREFLHEADAIIDSLENINSIALEDMVL